MSGDNADAQYGAKPPKEMRTVRRDGDIVTEDYEKVNPDGTVTKTITTRDEKTGQKQVSVYKMDKSGIVRKVDAVEQKKDDLIQQLRDQIAETKEKVDALNEFREKQNSKSVAYESGEYPNGELYRKRVVEDIPDDKYEIAHNLRNINKPFDLTPKQQALIQEHKQNILNYGTQKLIKQLHKKLNDDKFNEAYPLTDEQKDSVIEYGVRKLHRLLEKNLDEKRLIYDVMSFNPDFGNVDFSGRGTTQIPGDQSVSFKLNPYNEMAPEEYAKPVSFSMRPEKPSKPLPEPEKHTDRKVIHDGYKSLWDRLMKPDSILESVLGKQKENEKSKNEKYDNANEKVDSDYERSSADESENNFDKIKNAVKKAMAGDDMYQKSPLSPDQKEDIVDYALKQVRSVLKDSVKEKDDQKESSRKKKINLLEYFDEDEIYDYGRRALKRLVRKSLKAFDLDQDTVRQDKIEDPEVSKRRDAFYQYLGDVVEGKCKDTDPLPIKEKPKQDEEPESEQEPRWDYNSFLSSIFGQKDKTLKSEERPKEQKKKMPDFDSLFSWLMPDKEDKTDSEKAPSQPSESATKIKPRFYQLDPLKSDSKNEQNQSEAVGNGFDLKSLLKKIQEAAVKKFSEPMKSEKTESVDQQSYQDHEQSNINTKGNTQERELKASDVDAALARIRQSNMEASNSRRISNKPPYLKERISGLSSIPRPKITTASSSERNPDLSDQISFQLKPHKYDNINEEGDEHFDKRRFESGKPSSHEQDFQPWWIESPDTFLKNAFQKPLIKGGFMDTPMIS